MRADNLTDDKAAPCRFRSEFENLIYLALKADWGFRDLGSADDLRRPHCELRHFEFVHRCFILTGSDVHLLGERVSDHIRHELACLAGVSQRILEACSQSFAKIL